MAFGGLSKRKIFDGRGPSQYLQIWPLTVCRLAISPKHKIPFNANRILNDRSHVLYLSTRNRYQAILDGRYDERQEGLWMVFIGNSMQKKRVVRSWATRRIEKAVTETLRARGFDRNGRRLIFPDASKKKGSKSKSSPLESTPEYAPEALIGTVDVHMLHNSIETSFTEVQRQARVIVDKILEICGR